MPMPEDRGDYGFRKDERAAGQQSRSQLSVPLASGDQPVGNASHTGASFNHLNGTARERIAKNGTRVKPLVPAGSKIKVDPKIELAPLPIGRGRFVLDRIAEDLRRSESKKDSLRGDRVRKTRRIS